jgi:hypothetical protein
MSKKETQSFEVTQYSDVEFGIQQAHQVIIQIYKDLVRDAPAHAVWAGLVGNQLTVRYHTYTMFLPSRAKQIEEEADTVLKESVKHLKAEFKQRTGKTLKLSEQKELANHSVEKVSLNERYYYKAWRVYTISF